MASSERKPAVLLSSRDYALFYDQLGRCLKTGLPAGRSLRELASGATPRLRRALEAATVAIEAGAPIGETLAQHPELFPAHEAGYLGMAEAAGRLPSACEEMGRLHRARHERGRALGAKLAYPLGMLGLAVLALPLKELVLGETAAYVRAVAPPLLTLGLALTGGAFAWRLPSVRQALYALGWRLPVVRPCLQQGALAQLVRSLGHGYAAGLAPDRALRLAADGLPEGELRRAALGVAGRVAGGTELAVAMGAYPKSFPGRLREIVRTGEVSGTVDGTLMAAAEELEFEAQKAAEGALRLAAGAITALVVAGVAWQIVSQALAQVRQVQEQLGI